MLLFLYGTLRDAGSLGPCAGTPLRRRPRPARLDGFERVKLRLAPYPTLRRARRRAVEGVVLEVDSRMLANLKGYESVRYRLVPLPVTVAPRTRPRTRLAFCFIGDAPTGVPWHPAGKGVTLTARSRAF